MSDAEDRDPRRDSDEDEEETPLYQAIHLRRYTWKLVGYMLNSRSDPKCIKGALQFQCGEGDSAKTCLTLVFEKDLRVKALQTSNEQVTELEEEERAEAETPIVNVAVRERKPHKAGLRGKDAKSQIGPERDRGWKKPERSQTLTCWMSERGCGSSSKRIGSRATFQGMCGLTRWYVGKVFKRSVEA